MSPMGPTRDEELLCHLDPGFPPIAETDPERIDRITTSILRTPGPPRQEHRDREGTYGDAR